MNSKIHSVSAGERFSLDIEFSQQKLPPFTHTNFSFVRPSLIFHSQTNANIPQNKKLFAEMNSLVSKLIPVAKDLETVNILKDIQDLTLKFGGQ